jgi:hypothetical protein
MDEKVQNYVDAFYPSCVIYTEVSVNIRLTKHLLVKPKSSYMFRSVIKPFSDCKSLWKEKMYNTFE